MEKRADEMKASGMEGQIKWPGGLAGWLLGRLQGRSRPRTSLALLERIALAPRQSLALVEAEGRRFLIATSADGAPAFYPLEEKAGASIRVRRQRAS